MDTPVFEALAIQRHLRRAPRKVRLVADAVRGSSVSKALKRLEFTNKGSATDVSKVIKSAAANLRDKFQEERFENDDLIIKTIFVDEGVTLKEFSRLHKVVHIELINVLAISLLWLQNVKKN